MSDDSLSDFLKARKINLEELDPNERSKIDLEEIEARKIEAIRAKRYPMQYKDYIKVEAAKSYAMTSAWLNTCTSM